MDSGEPGRLVRRRGSPLERETPPGCGTSHARSDNSHVGLGWVDRIFERDTLGGGAKRFHGRHTGGLERRVGAVEDAEEDGSSEGEDEPSHLNGESAGEEAGNRLRNSDPGGGSQEAAQRGEDHRLGEKLKKDLEVGGPQGLSQADFIQPFRAEETENTRSAAGAVFAFGNLRGTFPDKL